MFQEDFDDNFENTGVTAIALYDYQAAADDEISFDPNDIITNIEMVRVFIIFLVLCLGMFLRIYVYWDYIHVLYRSEQSFFNFRWTMAGGSVNVMANLVYFPQIMSKSDNEKP